MTSPHEEIPSEKAGHPEAEVEHPLSRRTRRALYRKVNSLLGEANFVQLTVPNKPYSVSISRLRELGEQYPTLDIVSGDAVLGMAKHEKVTIRKSRNPLKALEFFVEEKVFVAYTEDDIATELLAQSERSARAEELRKAAGYTERLLSEEGARPILDFLNQAKIQKTDSRG